MILGRPSGVVCRPAAPGSTPVSKIATTTFRPSYSGCAYVHCQGDTAFTHAVSAVRPGSDDSRSPKDSSVIRCNVSSIRLHRSHLSGLKRAGRSEGPTFRTMTLSLPGAVMHSDSSKDEYRFLVAH